LRTLFANRIMHTGWKIATMGTNSVAWRDWYVVDAIGNGTKTASYESAALPTELRRLLVWFH
jgi:hypothetical protein